MSRFHASIASVGLVMMVVAGTACDDGVAPPAGTCTGCNAEDAGPGALPPMVDGGSIDGASTIDGGSEAEPDAGGTPPMGSEPVGAECRADDDCMTGLCIGNADSGRNITDYTCHAECIPLQDRTAFCENDDQCCEGRCCLACGPNEGLCVRGA